MKRIVTLGIIFCSLLIFSCTKEDPKDDPIDITNNDPVPIELTPTTRSFVEGGNNFAFKLTEQVAKQEKGNFMVSPLGVTLAFGMVLEAAEEGEAKDDVCKVLGFDEGTSQDIRNYCTTMLERLPEQDKFSKVALANMALVNSDFGAVCPSFSSAVSGYHNALVKGMSFENTTSVVDYVNGWAKENTNGMIEKAINEEDITSGNTAILANALYFDGKWKNRFKKSDTSKKAFTVSGGSIKKIEMMKQEDKFSFRWFFVDKTSQEGGMLRMPYGNGSFAMDVYLPYDEDKKVEDILALLAENKLKYQDWVVPKTDVWFPKFELKENRIDLKEILKDMGMEKALDGSNGWLSLFEKEEIKSCIDKVFQNTAIKVEEEGTEASAVTEITMKVGAAIGYNPQEEKLTFHCDHPFIYTITETSTGAILFAGVFRGE